MTPEHFHKQFDLNVLGLILASQEAVKQFGPDGGSIINISSVVATSAPPSASVYSATKAAVDAVTRSLAKELGPRKIRVNSINPGMVETEGVHAAGIAESDFRKQVESQTPLGRIGQPQDIAPAAVFLASVGFRLDHRRDLLHLGRAPVVRDRNGGAGRRRGRRGPPRAGPGVACSRTRRFQAPLSESSRSEWTDFDTARRRREMRPDRSPDQGRGRHRVGPDRQRSGSLSRRHGDSGCLETFSGPGGIV